MCPVRRLAAVAPAAKPPAPPFRVAIIGGGFAGAAAALRLIEAGNGPLAITVVEPRAALGRGIAYSTPEAGHLMNGPARSLSLYPEAPLNFVRWMEAEAIARRLAAAGRHRLGGKPAAARALRHLCRDPARGLRRRQLRAACGCATAATARSASACSAASSWSRSPMAAPCSPTRSSSPRASSSVAPTVASRARSPGTLGTSPIPMPRTPSTGSPRRRRSSSSAAGSRCSTRWSRSRAAGFRGRVRAVSRRGGLVEPRRPVEAAESFLDDAEPDAARRCSASVQLARRRIAAEGGDWQQLIPAVRAATPGLWTRLGDADRQRFVRHLQGVWKTCVHLAPIETHRLAERLQAEGRLSIEAGEIEAIEPGDERPHRRHGRRRRARGGYRPMLSSTASATAATGPSSTIRWCARCSAAGWRDGTRPASASRSIR